MKPPRYDSVIKKLKQDAKIIKYKCKTCGSETYLNSKKLSCKVCENEMAVEIIPYSESYNLKNKMITIEEFKDYLIEIFGKKIDSILEINNDDLFLMIKKIEKNPFEIDKCTKCKASKCRQDIPFWSNSIKKEIMVVSQDAGKGCEDNQFNCVFSLQEASIAHENYIKNSIKNAYYRLFSKITSDFINKIYFTDIIKCAYSTDKSIKLKECNCREEIFKEISVVNPKIIILMGTPALKAFIEITKNKSFIEIEKKRKILKQINRNINSSLSFREFIFEDYIKVFCIPHFEGNLQIGKEYKPDFDKFKEYCLSVISEQIKQGEAENL